MENISVTQFKAQALEVISRVAETRQGLVITKRGKPIAQLEPYRKNDARDSELGKLAHTLIYEGDIITPFGEEDWEAAQEGPEQRKYGR